MGDAGREGLPRAFARGARDQAVRVATTPRHVIMLGLLLGASWVTLDVYRDRVVQDVPVAVVDLDNSKISRTLREFLGAERELRVDGAEGPASADEARAALEQGRVAAVITIPEGVSRDVKRGRRAEVLLTVDSSNVLVGKNVFKAVSKAVGTVAAGAQLTLVTKLGERREHALARVVPVSVAETLSFNPAVNYVTYVAPGLVFFFLHVYALLLASSVFLPGGPTRPAERAGALATAFALTLAIGALLAWVFLPHVAVVPQSDAGLVVAAMAAFLVVDGLLAWAIAMVIPGPMSALQVTVIVGMLSLMLSGITWPLDMFPAPLAAVARVIPFTPFARGFQVFLHHPVGFGEVSPMFRSLGLQAGAFAAVALAARGVRALVGAARGRAA